MFFVIKTVVLGICLVVVQSTSKPAATLTQSAETVYAKLEWSMSMTQLHDRIQSVIDRGESPIGVKAWIDQQLLPQVRQTAQELQTEADGAEQAVADCSNLMWSAEKEASHRQSILEKDESDRFACIGEEHRLHKAELDACGDMNFVADQVVKTTPRSLNSVTNGTVEEVETILRESQQFFSDFYPKLVQKQTSCSEAKQAAVNQHATCLEDEAIIEQFYCTMKFGRDQACQEYDTCYETQIKAFDKTIADAKDLEVHVKERFKKLSCYSAKGEDLQAQCNSDTVNVAQLAISYPTKPQKQQCVNLMKTRRNYDDIVCKEGSVVPHGDHPGDAGSTSTGSDSNTTQASGDGNSSAIAK